MIRGIFGGAGNGHAARSPQNRIGGAEVASLNEPSDDKMGCDGKKVEPRRSLFELDEGPFCTHIGDGQQSQMVNSTSLSGRR